MVSCNQYCFPWLAFLFLLVLLATPLSAPLARHARLNMRLMIDRHLTATVPSPPLVLGYHNGPLLTGDNHSPLVVHLLWYGSFTPSQHSIVTDFLGSLQKESHGAHSVWSWWKTAARYVDKYNASVSNAVKLGGEFADAGYAIGKSLKLSDIQALVIHALKSQSLPSMSARSSSIYLVLTAADVYVERFCMNSCGFHDYSPAYRMLPFAWVGNSASQCPGQCAWPFAVPQFGPPNPPLLPPNGDVGIDGMIINIATVLAGAATNPFGTGFFQGDASAPLEAATACAGSFGLGSYPGYPGKLLVDKKTKASYNAYGVHHREFLLPALWNPDTLSCTAPA